jgi:hypothetical protein
MLLAASLIELAAACAPPQVVTIGEVELNVRPASRDLFDEVQSSIEKIQLRTERLSSRASKGEDLKGKSESIRKEIVELYRMVRAAANASDELLLRGELDGELLRGRVTELIEPLDSAVTSLRPHLGSTPGLINAATRRAKDQLGAIKQLDELIRQQRWTTAQQKLDDLLDAADEVGRFPERAEVEGLLRPLMERMPEVRAGYLREKKTTVIPDLRKEFSATRPSLEELRAALAAVSTSVKESAEIVWQNRSVDGPSLVGSLADLWPATDKSVLRSLAALYAIGPPAESDLNSLRSDYEAARIEAATLVRDLILADARRCTGDAAEQRYAAYLAAIPRFATSLHIAVEDALSASAALNQLAAKSPELEQTIRAYRVATAESVRWRRRVANRNRQKFHELAASEQLPALIDNPPARPGGPTGAPVLPGQSVPAEQRRFAQAHWTIDQSPDWVASQWSSQWNGTNARLVPQTVRWDGNGDPTLVSQWHQRTVAEASCPRQSLVASIDRLARDLLLTSNQPPISLESALALHTAAHGPYVELGGRMKNAVLDNLPDRLFDKHLPSETMDALAPGTLVAYPLMPGLVRLQFDAHWLVHDLFAERLNGR